MKYTEHLRTRWHDTDAERRVSPSRILEYMQETSNGHTRAAGRNLDNLRDEKHLAYILSKLRLEILQPLHAFEDITVETWTSPSRGYSSLRSFQILRGGEVVARADSTWALVNVVDRSLCKPDEAGYAFEHEEPVAIDLPLRIRFPADVPLERIGERRVVYSDLDYNMHMNNTRYPNMLCDFLPDMQGKYVTSLNLAYINEASVGETLRGFARQDGDAWYIRTLRENGDTNAEARLTLADL